MGRDRFFYRVSSGPAIEMVRFTFIPPAIRGGEQKAGKVLGTALSSRHAIRTNPTLARELCPPSKKKRDEDLEIARYLLEHKSLYQQALKDGGAAIAQR